MSAYLLPYFVNDRNQTKVMCAQKQVLSYEAIGNWESRKSGDWQTLAGKIATDGNILLADGKSEGISGTRLQGMLLPAGGKMAFFGGGFEKNDKSLRATAVREFHEELGFGQKKIDINVSSLKEIHSECSGKYKYFAVELRSHQLRNLDLERINQDIAAFERGSDLQKIYNRDKGKQQSGARFPEMHAIKWVDLEDLEREVDNHGQDSTFISGQCQKFCTFLSKVLKVKAHPSFTERIIDHLNKEPVDWSVTAAKELIRHLSE